MSGPNCVVVCVKCDDFNNDSDQQIINGRRHGIRAITNRGATHSQLDSHKECYLAQEIWSLDLLKVCRQIYHEGRRQFHSAALNSWEPQLMDLSGHGAFPAERICGG
jgi:hypothetical protein